MENKYMLRYFIYKKKGMVRTILKDNQAWFCLKDVCKLTGIVNSKNYTKRLIDDNMGEYIGMVETEILGENQYDILFTQAQEYMYLAEPVLYYILFRTRKKEVEEFRLWLFKEIIPVIRKWFLINDKNEKKDNDKENVQFKVLKRPYLFLERK